ncbi:MAG: hydrogenase expression/formation protein HypE [Acidobacteria bacterium]|nr:hydrogenase expression/formation protein HypE [Acidobacteriota bacterium]
MDKIILAHGEGGKLTRELIEEIIFPFFKNETLQTLTDSAILGKIGGGEIAFTTDSYVVSPIFFEGGDIGSLSVFGTVNDLCMSGATPLAISFSLIIEEGFEIKNLEKILKSAAKGAKDSSVIIAAGDTKVVPKGKGDGIFITTSGVGVIKRGRKTSDDFIKEGDQIIVSGDIGRHGATIAAHRHNLKSKKLSSDCAHLNKIIDGLFNQGLKPKSLHDPTRGGLATLLNEVAKRTKLGIEIDEGQIPVSKEVVAVCEVLGLDPLYLPCEGRFVGIFEPQDAGKAIDFLKKETICKECSIIGEVTKSKSALYPVILKTKMGSSRPVDELSGIQLPRIC